MIYLKNHPKNTRRSPATLRVLLRICVGLTPPIKGPIHHFLCRITAKQLKQKPQINGSVRKWGGGAIQRKSAVDSKRTGVRRLINKCPAQGRTETPQTRKMLAPTGPASGRIAMKKGHQARSLKRRCRTVWIIFGRVAGRRASFSGGCWILGNS